MDVATLAELLRETAQHHDHYEKTHPKHNWWDWYAPYLSARQNGSTPEEAAAAADRYMESELALGAGNFGTRWGHGAERNQARKVFDASSWGHRFSPVVFDDPNYQRREYGRFTAYGQSKTENILFAVALDECGKAEGVGAFSLHPCSIVSTDLKRELSDEELRSADVINEKGEPVLDPARALKTVEQGAATQVWCATSPQLDGKGASIARIVRWPDPCLQAKSTSGTWEIRLARLA